MGMALVLLYYVLVVLQSIATRSLVILANKYLRKREENGKKKISPPMSPLIYNSGDVVLPPPLSFLRWRHHFSDPWWCQCVNVVVYIYVVAGLQEEEEEAVGGGGWMIYTAVLVVH